MRGEVHRLKSDRRAKGSEQTGNRYAVELQSDHLLLPTVIVAPTTTNPVGASFWPAITLDGVTTYVLVEQMQAVDPGRLGPVLAMVSYDEQEAIDDRLRDVLAL